jgi:hypothetical protein
MKLKLRRGFSRGFLAPAVALAVALPATAAAQQSLPAGIDVIARHVAASGGRAAWLAKRSAIARGTFEMPAMGVVGEFEQAQTSDGNAMVRITVPGLGELTTGVRAGMAWGLSPITGPRLLDGDELATLLEETSFFSGLREAPLVTALETVALTELGGERCYRVRVRWASGRRTHDCYSVETGLLVGIEASQSSPTGVLDMLTLLSGYREFAGLKLPTVATQRAAGQEQVIRFTHVEFDSVADDVFAVPPAIAEILEQRRRSAPRR